MIGFVAQGRQSLMRYDQKGCGLGDGDSSKPPNFTFGNLPMTAPFTLLCAIRKDSVRADFNGVPVLEYRGDFSLLRLVKPLAGERAEQLFLELEGRVAFEITSHRYVPVGSAKPTAVAPPTVASTPMIAGSGLLPAATGQRRPVPEAKDQQAALALIKDVYKDDFAAARLPDKKSALAGKLLEQAKQATDSTERYVLLGEARTQAIDGDDPLVLRQILATLVGEFDVPAASTLIDAWKAHLARSRPAALIGSIYDDATGRFDAAVTAAEFDDAKLLGDFLTVTAPRLGDAAAVKLVREKNLALVERRKEYDAAKAADEKLAAAPDDAEANLTVGRYRALVERDWQTAFPLLAKGSDELWKDLATKSLAAPADPNARAALGDAWWDAAQSKPAQKADLTAGALYWYGVALPSLSGLQKARVEKRIQDAAPLVPAPKLPPTTLALRPSATPAATTPAEMPFVRGGLGDPKPIAPPIPAAAGGALNLLELINLEKHLVHGTWTKVDGILVGGGVNASRVHIPNTPPAEYDLIYSAQLVKGTNCGLLVGLIAGGNQSHVQIGPDRFGICIRGGVTNNKYYVSNLNLPVTQPFQFICSVRKDSISTTLNGQKLLEYREDFAQLDSGPTMSMPVKNQLFVGAGGDGQWKITSISLKPVR
jgi:hypothetical protein